MKSFSKKLLTYSLATFLGVMLMTTLLRPTCSADVYWTNYDINAIAKADPDGSNPNQKWIQGFAGPLGVVTDSSYIYWANYDDNTIGRANLDGSNPNQNWITGCHGSKEIAVDANYIYWTNFDNNTIGRANLDGSNPNQGWITGCDAPDGVVVDSNYVYWANYDGNTIGRADLNGDNPDQGWINGCAGPNGFAVDSNYVYWTNYDGLSVSRADLDGGNPDQDWITECPFPWGSAVNSSHVYWINELTQTIGRADLDGGNPDQGFITGCIGSYAIAVDSTYVYWPNYNGSSIGRADLDGDNPNQNWMIGCNGPDDVAVDANHVYWANYLSDTIGRANLDGSDPVQNWITGCTGPTRVVVNANHVYWTNYDGDTIGRADLDGGNPDQSWIDSCNGPDGITIDETHVYWANYDNNTIDRADLDGSNPNQSWISGCNGPTGIAVNSTHVFWANYLGDTIGRAKLDKSNLNQAWIIGCVEPVNVAVDANHAYWTNYWPNTIGRVELDGGDLNHAWIESCFGPDGIALTPAPTITSFSPASGRTGTTVIITGTNFNNATRVQFGGTDAQNYTVDSATQITAEVGNGTSGNISVTTPGGTVVSADPFTYIPPPTITSFSPASGRTGTTVIIKGTNFNGATRVQFGGTDAQNYTVDSATQITAEVGNGTSGNISVTTPGGTVVSADPFTYIPPPTITSFSPASGRTGTTVIIKGTNFNNATRVQFGGTDAQNYNVDSATQITAEVGNGTSGNISVTTPGGTVVSADPFTYIPPVPIVASFSPTSCGTGTTVTITGNHFTGTEVKFGGTDAASFTVDSPTQISAVVGAGSTGNVTVTTDGGTGTSASTFTYIPTPTITFFKPTSGTTGTAVTITGNHFTGATRVQFGGTDAQRYAVDSTTQITAEVGTGGSGNITVTTPGGTAASHKEFYYAPPIPTLGEWGMILFGLLLLGGTFFVLRKGVGKSPPRSDRTF